MKFLISEGSHSLEWEAPRVGVRVRFTVTVTVMVTVTVRAPTPSNGRPPGLPRGWVRGTVRVWCRGGHPLCPRSPPAPPWHRPRMATSPSS